MSKIFATITPLIFLTLIAGMAIYLAKRVAWGFGLNPRIAILTTIGLLLIFMVSTITIMRLNLTNGFSHLLNNISNIGIGVFTIMLFSILVTDLVQLFLKMPPRTFGFLSMGLTVLVSAYSLWNAQNTKVYHQNVEIANLEQPLRIAQLTDIHIGHFWGKRTVDKLIRKVERENVDAVVITGDMFDGRVRLTEEVLHPFARLTVPIYFVEGNHDGYSGSEDIKMLLRKNGITVLDNQKIEFKGLQIVGLDYLLADKNSINTFHAPPKGVTIQEVLPTLEIDKNKPYLMLHHNPVGVEYAAENGINLYLAGHTHAGQMFPATLIAKAMFEYNKGLYRYNDSTQIYVSQGSGTFGPPMRLGTHSEITILNLR